MAININTPSDVIAATTSTGRKAYPAQTPNAQFVRIFNDGATTAFVASGDSSVTATANNTPIGGGKSVILAKSEFDTHLAAIMASGTANIYYQAVGADYLTGF